MKLSIDEQTRTTPFPRNATDQVSILIVSEIKWPSWATYIFSICIYNRMATPIVYKFSDAIAHDGPTLCVSIGPTSGQVLATGGQDAFINLWRLGKPVALGHLGGHKRPVTAVLFDRTENVVASGSESGSIKIFDVPKVKVSRSFTTGHRANVTCLDFHPLAASSAIVATGGGDMLVKLWDARTGGEYMTYRGHAAAVTALHFSPDGRWLASGSADGAILLWDLTAGKLLHTFDPAQCHRSAVTALDFHPEELVMASAGDRTVRFWSLGPAQGVAAAFGLLTVSPSDASPIRTARFQPDGVALAAATNEHLRMWSVPIPRSEPGLPDAALDAGSTYATSTLDVVPVPWTGVTAIWMGSNVKRSPSLSLPSDGDHGSARSPPCEPLQLVACSVQSGTMLRTWGVDLMVRASCVAASTVHLTPVCMSLAASGTQRGYASICEDAAATAAAGVSWDTTYDVCWRWECDRC
jgi:hypothetical protein